MRVSVLFVAGCRKAICKHRHCEEFQHSAQNPVNFVCSNAVLYSGLHTPTVEHHTVPSAEISVPISSDLTQGTRKVSLVLTRFVASIPCSASSSQSGNNGKMPKNISGYLQLFALLRHLVLVTSSFQCRQFCFHFHLHSRNCEGPATAASVAKLMRNVFNYSRNALR